MNISSRTFRLIDKVLFASTVFLIGYAMYWAFLIVPNERLMGPVQRVFYFHVGSAIACYVSFALVFFGSILYLATRDMRYDIISHASGEVGFVFCTIVLASGMIWGHAAWNTWFRFEPRLVSFLLLWLVYMSFVLLRTFGEAGKVASHSAVLGIIGALSVPVMIYSIKILPATAQLHPQLQQNKGLSDPSFQTALLIAMGGLILLQFLLIRIRYRIEILTREAITR